MYGRWLNIVVVVFWLATMGWLLTSKVIPSWLVGNPPDYQKVLERQRNEPAVGWDLSWNDRKLGWAVSRTKPLADELTGVRSVIRFEQFPLGEITPEVLRPLLPGLNQITNRLKMQVETELEFDPLGQLSRFDTAVGFPQEEQLAMPPGTAAVRMQGAVDGAKVRLWIRYRDEVPLEPELPIPREAMLRDALSPQSHLPNLREGQTWTVETYNPLLVPGDPKELLHATVEAKAPLFWNHEQMETWLVVFRSDSRSSLGSEGDLRGKLWVAQDGRVLKQQVQVFRSTLTFIRQPDKEAAELAKRVLKSEVPTPP